MTTFIFWVFFVIIDKFFSKSTRYFKPYKPCKTKNKNNHVFIILKRFLFCLLLILFSYKINDIKTNFLEVLERQDSQEVFNKDSYFVMQDIAKNETKKILSYYPLSKIVLRKHKFYFRYILLLSGDINLNPGPCTGTFPFSKSSFSGSESRFHLGSNDENLDTEKWTNFKKRGLHFIHININSLLPKIDETRHMTKIANAAIVGIGETKLDESILSSEIDIEGYDLLRLDLSRRGGGVACYVKKSLAYNYRDNFCKNTESIFSDNFLPKTKPILIGILYRPPDKNDFFKNLEETFTNCNILDKQECCLLGDFNINIFQNGENVFEKKLSNSKLNSIPFIVAEYLDFAFSYSLKQLISTPTRTTENTATLIDHALTNSPHQIIKSGVVEVNLSDNELIYCTRKTTKLKSNKHSELNIRSMKNFTAEGFVELLKKIDFPNYETYACVNMAYLDFVTKIVDSCYKKCKVSKLETDKDLLREAKRILKATIQRKKGTFFQDKIQENLKNSKELWKTLKSLGFNSKKTGQSKICLKEDGVIQFEPPLKFNAKRTKVFYKKLTPNTEKFELLYTMENITKKLLCCLDVSKAPGIDEIPSRFLKDGAEILAKPISDIINLSIKLSTFPDKCKITKLIPLFKKGSKTDPKNYVPISLLPLLSKLIEKAIHIQTQEYLDKHGLLYKFQSGFRTKFSTNSCLIQLSDFIINGMDKGLHTGMILIDLQKPVIKWFKSYLSNRNFFVLLEGVFSEEGLLTCGVPQGSILGPLLFLIYISDLPQTLSETASYLYADDTCIYYQHKNVQEIEAILNKEFSSLCEWFIDNKLSIHFGEDKTKSILFTWSKTPEKLNISFQDHSIRQYNCVEYLGCFLDYNLNGETMVRKILKKINDKLKFLYRQADFLNPSCNRLWLHIMVSIT